MTPMFRGVVVSLLCVALAACGSQISHEELRAEASGSVTQSTTATGTPAPELGGNQGTDGTVTGDGVAATGSDLPDGQGASSGSTATTAPAAGASPASGAVATPGVSKCTSSKSPIKIGSVGEYSGLIGGLLKVGVQAVQAWATYVNSVRGGVSCHPVQVIVKDDGGDPAKNQALTQQLVEQDKVVAFVYNGAAIAGGGSVAYLNSHNVPVIGNENASSWMCEGGNFFPAASSCTRLFESTFAGMGQYFGAKGLKKLASVACIEVPLCSGVTSLASGYAQKYGMSLVYNAAVSIVQPDYTATCQAAKDAGAEVVYLGLDGNSDERLARSCNSIGYHPKYASTDIALYDKQKDDPLEEGILVTHVVAPWMVEGIPGIAEYQAATSKYAPGLVSTGGSMDGWASAKLFEAATTALPDNPTGKDVIDGDCCRFG